MRRLLYVPVIHDEVDIGSAGPALQQQSCLLAEERGWAKHQERAKQFWENISAYLGSFASGGLNVYQDGLPAGGEIGKRIVAEAANRGSKNYQVVQELLDRGAELCQTEDPALLLQEHRNLSALVNPREPGKADFDPEEYQTRRDQLTEARDKFIAGTIGATLAEGESGILFIGAYHRVARYLAADISVEEVKDPETVQAYLDCLFLGRDQERLQELCQYLVSPIVPPAS
ncbi:MAG: hypothetical protein HQ475_00875 [SAR202 cluster bacterium]|nr:hypothetical protein [SAR202 cluster bacterium]